jgi:hypothetical protein
MIAKVNIDFVLTETLLNEDGPFSFLHNGETRPEEKGLVNEGLPRSVLYIQTRL